MASKNEKLTLTSVKVHQELFDEFKVASIKIIITDKRTVA